MSSSTPSVSATARSARPSSRSISPARMTRRRSRAPRPVRSAEDASPDTVSGTLVVSDVDFGEAELQPVAAGTSGDNGYGTFEVLANGQWTYTLGNSDPDVQAQTAGQVVTDTITVWSEDLSISSQIEVTIHGTNDVPVIAGVVSTAVHRGGRGHHGNLTARRRPDDCRRRRRTNRASCRRPPPPGGTVTACSRSAADGRWTYAAANAQTADPGARPRRDDHRQLHLHVSRTAPPASW